MEFINNINDLNYLTWKRSINQILLYQYFKDIVSKKNNSITSEMKVIEKLKQKTELQSKKYMELLDQLISNSSSLYKQIEDNLNNKELLNSLYLKKNIDVSEAGYKRWLETGEKIKI